MKMRVVLNEEFLKKNFSECARNLIGSMENVLYDYDETDTEYINAKEYLADFDTIVKDVIDNGTTAIYDEGFCGWGEDVTNKLTKAYRQFPEETIYKWAVNAVKAWL